MIYISTKKKLAPENIPSDLRRYGNVWCEVWCRSHEELFGFAAMTKIDAKFIRGGKLLVPGEMRERLIQAGAEPSY